MMNRYLGRTYTKQAVPAPPPHSASPHYRGFKQYLRVQTNWAALPNRETEETHPPTYGINQQSRHPHSGGQLGSHSPPSVEVWASFISPGCLEHIYTVCSSLARFSADVSGHASTTKLLSNSLVHPLSNPDPISGLTLTQYSGEWISAS